MLTTGDGTGVSWYTTGVAHVPVTFPEGMADCRHCWACYYSDAFDVYRCTSLGREAYIEKSELNQRHRLCPVEFPETPF